MKNDRQRSERDKNMNSARKNYMYNTAFSVLNMLIPLVTAPYLARILGSTGVGVYTFYFSIAQYFTIFSKMGLTNYGTRHIAAIRDNRESIKREFTNLYVMQLGMTLIISICYFGYVIFFAKDKSLAGIFGVWVLSAGFDIDWLLFALEEFKTAAIRNCFVKLMAAGLVMLLVRSAGDIWKYAWITTAGYCGGYAFLWGRCKEYISVKSIDFKMVGSHIRPCFLLMIPVLALNIYRTMDKVMLGVLSNMGETGLYEYAEKLVYCLTVFISSLGAVMMPKVSNFIAKKDMKSVSVCMFDSMVFLIFLSSGMCFGIAAIADSLIPLLYGVQFNGSITLLKRLAITLIFIAWGNVIRTQYVIPGKRDGIYIASVTTGAVVNLLANIILIPRYDAAGACMGTVCAEFSVLVCQAFFLHKELPYREYLKKTLPFILLGLAMYTGCKWIECRLGVGLFTMLIQIICGGIAYAGVSFVYLRKVLEIKS